MFKYAGLKNRVFVELLDAEVFAVLCRNWFPAAGGCMLALLAENSREDLPALQALCRAHGVSLFGAIFPALLRDAAVVPNGMLLIQYGGAPEPRLYSDLAASDRSKEVAEDFVALAEKELVD